MASPIPIRWLGRVVVLAAVAAISAASASARAQSASLRVAFPRPLPGPLFGGGPGGGTVGRGPAGGPLLGIEGGWATTLAVKQDASQRSGAFGVKVGWAWVNGVSAQVRYDDLGVEPAFARKPLQLTTAGLRYSVPFIVPTPFIEVETGPAFVLGGVQASAGGGLGVCLPLGPVLIDVLGHDWLVPIAGTLRQTFTVGIGFTILFPSSGRR